MGRSNTYATWHARHRTSTARRALGLIGALMLTLAAMAGPSGAMAQESGEPEETELELSQPAYWNNKSAKALPDVITSEFPPGVTCIVVPDLCGDTAREVTGPVSEVLPEEDEQPPEPIGPTVQPGTLPTGRMGGVEKYNAAFTFGLPDAPEGQEVASFTLVLTETDPTYTYSSPATRQAVLAALVGVQTEDPEAAAAEMQKILDCDPSAECPYPPVDDTIMRVEICPIVDGYEEGDSQPWEDRPEVDCIFGAEGERQDDGSWHFDLTMFAQSLADGSMEQNEGILIRPLSAENFAFGDKETTDNAQVSFAGIEDEEDAPIALVSFQEEMSTEAFTLDEGEASGDLDASGSAAGTSGDGFDGGASGTSGSQSGEAFSSAPAFESQDTAAAPEQEAAPEVAEPAGGGDQAAAPEMQNAAQPGFYWQVWLLLPLGLAAMYVLSRSLTAEPALAAERSGAMTRLIEQRRASGDGGTTGMFQV